MADKSDASRIVGERIRELREQRGLSRKRLSDFAGLDTTHLARIELGDGNPTLHKLIQVAAALDTSVSTLVDGIGREHLPASATRPVTEAEVIAELRRRGADAPGG